MSNDFRELKGEPPGERAKELLRERTRLQIEFPEKDALSSRLIPCIEHFKNELHGSILDVGCYTGFLYRYLGQPLDYTGIDKWLEAIEVAKEFHPHADFRVADGFDFQGSYDVLWCSQITWGKTSITAKAAINAMKPLAKKCIFIIRSGDAGDVSDVFDISGGLSAVVVE